jgi:hypothetical protein
VVSDDGRPAEEQQPQAQPADGARRPEILPEARAADADRAAVAERLRDAFADGRLDEDEFDVRIHAALSARTTRDLEHLLDDLGPLAQPLSGTPASGDAAPVASPRVIPARRGGGREHGWTLAVMSGNERKGRWRVPEETTTVAIMGGTLLDLRTATLTSQVTTITAVAIMGGVEVIVPPGVRVDVSGFGFMGGLDDRVQDDDLPSTTPIIRLKWFALMGGVGVYTKRPGKKGKARELAEG